MLHATERVGMLPSPAVSWSKEVGPVVETLETMGTEQVLLAMVFFGSYALALGQFAGPRGRLVAIATAVVAAAGFAAFSRPWEAGVILIALVPICMGLFAGTAWLLWMAATWNTDAPSATIEHPRGNARRGDPRWARRARAPATLRIENGIAAYEKAAKGLSATLRNEVQKWRARS